LVVKLLPSSASSCPLLHMLVIFTSTTTSASLLLSASARVNRVLSVGIDLEASVRAYVCLSAQKNC